MADEIRKVSIPNTYILDPYIPVRKGAFAMSYSGGSIIFVEHFKKMHTEPA